MDETAMNLGAVGSKDTSKANRYQQLIEWVFQRHYVAGDTAVYWERPELVEGARELGIALPRNLGDVVYAIRYRIPLPQSVVETAPAGTEWIIRGNGRAKYVFNLIPAQVRIRPDMALTVIKIPNSTPEIIAATALGDEQALLALLRYNRLVDIFLGVTAYSLQNHLRTTTRKIGQVEIDEVYVAVDQHGRQFVVPVQAKGGNDEIGITQTEQDLAVCADKWPDMICRPVSAQFVADGRIALFELALQDEQIRVRRQAHYKLVPAAEVTKRDLDLYALASDEGTVNAVGVESPPSED
ncbi:endonuclease [Actinobaculum sp. 313]|uniref:endonuclease n=1 Tax=Actinobaculum sp. 313 TaxID=2495645 RepID=UPI00196B8447|nr:endonuclease [Actinobaculum sp. 313]